jgi:glyceraldehyde 3-phosphate dehydrogenase
MNDVDLPPIRLAVNGFGRIGRMVVRALLESGRRDLEIVAINDLNSAEANAYYLRYDTVHGRFGHDVTVESESEISVGTQKIHVCRETDPLRLPWNEIGVDIVVEATGRFTSREAAAQHLKAGARRVLIAAPSANADYTIAVGVNDHGLRDDHIVVSNGSCTTNCLACVASVIDDVAGIARGYMTTVHAYTADQSLQDGSHKDPRRSRAAAASLIPTTTGAAKTIGSVLPNLAGRLQGTSIRVPTIDVCLLDLKLDCIRSISREALNKAFEESSENGLKSVLATTHEPLVSSDFIHHPASAIVDLTETCVIDSSFVRVLAWYDNEWAFSNRLLDAAAKLGCFVR